MGLRNAGDCMAHDAGLCRTGREQWRELRRGLEMKHERVLGTATRTMIWASERRRRWENAEIRELGVRREVRRGEVCYELVEVKGRNL